MEWSLQEFLSITGARVVRWESTAPVHPIRWLKNAKPGAVYFPAWQVDLRLLQDLQLAKASGVVLHEDQEQAWIADCPDLGILTLPTPMQGFHQLAASARTRSNGIVVGITGSTGKSSTKQLLAAILRTRYSVGATFANLNRNQDAAALLLGLGPGEDDAVVIEMGFDRPGDMDEMAAMARPNAGIITKVTHHHLTKAGSWERLIEEKGRLGSHVLPDGLLVLNGDDPGCRRLLSQPFPCQVKTYGQGEGHDMTYQDVTVDESGTACTLVWAGNTLRCRLKALGAVQAENAAAAALVALHLGFTPNEIRRGLESARPERGRFEVIRFDHGVTIIDDTFNGSIEAMCKGLETAAALVGSRRFVAGLGGINGLGEHGDELHRGVGESAVACGVDELFIVADEGAAAICKGALDAGLPREMIHVVPRDEFATGIERALGPNTILYCKGNYWMGLGPEVTKICKALKAAGYQML